MLTILSLGCSVLQPTLFRNASLLPRFAGTLGMGCLLHACPVFFNFTSLEIRNIKLRDFDDCTVQVTFA